LMTDLRFGTDTGRVAPNERSRSASAGGDFSQRVTSGILLKNSRLREDF
jgi:hypothetical protein